MSNANPTIKIGKTNYTIVEGGMSPCDHLEKQVYVAGPRGAQKLVICYADGCVRIISYSRATRFYPAAPRGHKDIYGPEAEAIREVVMAF